MPTYFFHRMDGGFDPDLEGTELEDPRAARSEALQYAAETMKQHPEKVWDGGMMRVEVTDENGRVVTTVIVLTIDAQTPEAIRKLGSSGRVRQHVHGRHD